MLAQLRQVTVHNQLVHPLHQQLAFFRCGTNQNGGLGGRARHPHALHEEGGVTHSLGKGRSAFEVYFLARNGGTAVITPVRGFILMQESF